MKNINEHLKADHIPKQEVGNQVDAMEERSFENEADALAFYQVAKFRLLNVNKWSTMVGSGLSGFRLYDRYGQPADRLVEERDYIKIDIPGPGSRAGDGYDWVSVEHLIEENEGPTEVTMLQVRPCTNPLNGNPDTAHFLTEQATSTFQVKRIGKTVYAEEHGRNEQANTYTTDTVDNMRNMVVGWAAMLGLSYPQWKSLVRAILEKA